MPRPKSKQELEELSNENFSRLLGYISTLSEEERNQEFPPGTLNRNIRDILAHLHEWHLMMLNWYEIGMSGKKPEMPAKGYTWKMTSELNHEIQKKFSSTPLTEVESLLRTSFSNLQSIINKHTNEELFDKERYSWTGSTSLGAYLISSTSSHYDWALKLIKKCRKNL
ncbi:MAG: hypothetical protein CL670_08220 [Balneola sp.]|jgi:hypothetical protein|nr:hypothetical protein [Balneola sp.]MBE79122.1 hypothetical protein [Balneola sp.]|tara:strand:- start:161 stop:664 length:504 start_codon:yes stop_codon:yes gene_type:complete